MPQCGRMNREEKTVSAIVIALIVVWAISALGLIIFVLMHSGKGTGLSDMLAGGVASSMGGTSIIEKNLDRITIVFAIIFTVTLFLMMLFYPNASNILA